MNYKQGNVQIQVISLQLIKQIKYCCKIIAAVLVPLQRNSNECDTQFVVYFQTLKINLIMCIFHFQLISEQRYFLVEAECMEDDNGTLLTHFGVIVVV